MMNKFLTIRRLAVLLALSVVIPHAHAESAPPLYNASVSLLSDYLWRGQSQTWGKPALQFSLEASHTAGIYTGFFASNVSSQWVPGAQLETDWYAGVRDKLPGKLAEIGYDLNLNYAYFPGGNFNKTGFSLPSSSPNTLEISLAANYQWLTVKTGRVLGKFYGWDTGNSSPGSFAGDAKAGVTGNTQGSYFLEANASQDIAANWNLTGQIGHQSIKNSTGLSWHYYKIGLNHNMNNWLTSLTCTASSEPNAFKNFVGLTNNGSIYSAARPAMVFSITRNL